MDETIIVVTGAAPLTEGAVAALPHRRLVLAADGGLDHALAAGLRPSGLVGDLDSISEEGLAWAEEHATISRHDPDKDRTDTELALALAADLDPERIILLAGDGDRIDHMLAAIGALGAPTLTSVPELDAWWGDHRIRVVHGPGRSRLQLASGTVLSLLATHGPCTGVSVSGVRWPLDGVSLAPLVGHGVSNVAETDEVEVAVSSGVLTVIVPPSPEEDSP